jgi:hypothetical protein
MVNASPVIALARVGQVELLSRFPQQSILPQAVKEELFYAAEGDPARQAIEGGLFVIVETPTPPPEIIAWDSGKGETDIYHMRSPAQIGLPC